MTLKFVKRNKLCTGLMLAAFATLWVPGALAALPARFEAALARGSIKSDSVSLLVSTSSGETLFEHNADAPMRSASLMKMLTSYAALELLGPAWTWPTEAYISGDLHEGTLKGPLILKGYGDPALTIERLWLLTRQLQQRGLLRIEGGLIIDQSHFSPAPPQVSERIDWPWEIIPGPLFVNFQVSRLFFERQDKQVLLRAEPDLGWQFRVNLPVVDGPCYTDVEDEWRPRMDWSSEPPQALIYGRFPSECTHKELNLGITDGNYYISTVFRQLWQSQGGSLSGPVHSGVISGGARPFARIESAPLARVIVDMNKFSNNAMARLVYQSIGKSRAGTDSANSSESADSAIREWLKSQGMEFPELVQETGSGLSPRERLSVRSWVTLLQKASRSRYAAEFAASLPIVGVDGTMSRRLRNEAGMGWGHFKTGTLSDTKGLAGYLQTSKGRSLLVAVQINEANLGRRADTALEDLLRLLFEDEADSDSKAEKQKTASQ